MESKEQQAKAMKEALVQVSALKKHLKTLSKNQLIQALLQQVGVSVEQQNINRQLLEEIQELKKGNVSETK